MAGERRNLRFYLQEVGELLRRECPVGGVAIRGGEKRGGVSAELRDHLGEVGNDAEESF